MVCQIFTPPNSRLRQFQSCSQLPAVYCKLIPWDTWTLGELQQMKVRAGDSQRYDRLLLRHHPMGLVHCQYPANNRRKNREAKETTKREALLPPLNALGSSRSPQTKGPTWHCTPSKATANTYVAAGRLSPVMTNLRTASDVGSAETESRKGGTLLAQQD